MHEIRTTLAPDCVAEAVRLAHAAGIEQVSVVEVFVHGPNTPRRQLSVEASTPKARAFVEAFLSSPTLSKAEYALTSREVRAIVDGSPIERVTPPMSEPFPDVIQDLWQLSHVTASYIGRAAAGSILLATGIIKDDPVSIVVAALFLPFLSQALAVGFGMWSRQRGLLLQGLRALLVSTMLALAAGALAGWLHGGPIRYAGFKSPLSSFCISCIIGLTAGLSTADDTGRRYLIGVAAAVQFAVFPVWLGAAWVIGMPSHDVVYLRLGTFAINLITISVSAFAAYASVYRRRGHGLAAPLSGRKVPG